MKCRQSCWRSWEWVIKDWPTNLNVDFSLVVSTSKVKLPQPIFSLKLPMYKVTMKGKCSRTINSECILVPFSTLFCFEDLLLWSEFPHIKLSYTILCQSYLHRIAFSITIHGLESWQYSYVFSLVSKSPKKIFNY